MINWYAGRAQFKTRVGIASTDTNDDATIDASLGSISREIDRYLARRMYVEQRTRYFTARCPSELLVDDLLSISSLKTDTDCDRVYETTWATTDYDLEPANALFESPPEPFMGICLSPLGRYTFPTHSRGIEIVGKWGYYEALETVSSLTAEALDTSETGVDVVSGAAYDVGQTLLIDSEQMFISAISSNTLTVERGVNGTTAASHLTGATVQRYTYPGITEPTLMQAILNWRSYKGAGAIGSDGEFAQQVAGGLHPFVRRQLETYRRLEVG